MLNHKLRDEAFRLKEEGLTYIEISRRLNVAYSTVKTWFFRAGRAPLGSNEPSQGVESHTRPNQPQSNTFSEDDQQLLSANPYVRSVSQSQIRFTQSFREEYWKRYVNGEKPKDILINMGVSPETLGEARIYGLHKRISDAAASGLLSIDPETEDSDIMPDSVIPMRAMAQMRHELAYLRQEVEFIKKILSRGEAKRS